MSLTQASNEAKDAYNSMAAKVNVLLKAGEALINNKDPKKETDLNEKWHKAWMAVPGELKNAKNKLATLEKELADHLQGKKDPQAKGKSSLETIITARLRIAKIKEGTGKIEAALRESLK